MIRESVCLPIQAWEVARPQVLSVGCFAPRILYRLKLWEGEDLVSLERKGGAKRGQEGAER